MAVPLRQYDYDYDYAYEPQYHRRRPSGSRRVIWFILFLIITWFSLPPWGSVDTEILSHEMDANNTCLYTTIKVENNTHTFAYQVQTVVYLTRKQRRFQNRESGCRYAAGSEEKAHRASGYTKQRTKFAPH